MPFYPNSEFSDDSPEAIWNTLNPNAAKKLGQCMVGHLIGLR